MAETTIYPMTPLPAPSPCVLACELGPPENCSASTCDFEGVIQALNPDVYWRMDDSDLSVQCSDYSGNDRHGEYEELLNLTAQQGSLVPANSLAVSVAVASIEYPALAYAHDTDDSTATDDWWDTTHPSFSVCIKRTSPVVTDDVYICARAILATDPIYWLKFLSGGDIELRHTIADCNEQAVLATSGLNLADGNPHIITAIIDPGGRGLELWVDCVLVASAASSNPICSTNDLGRVFYVGNTPILLSGFYSLGGYMSHFIFGKRVWTVEEITTLQCTWKCE